jgi:putative flippase GtrA
MRDLVGLAFGDTCQEFKRFGIVAVLGLIVDVSVAWLLMSRLGAPIVMAGAVGFLAGAAFNYMLHELWTFQGGARRLSASRAMRQTIVFVIVFWLRVAAIATFARISSSQFGIIAICGAAGVSLCANYLLSKLFVYASVSANPGRGSSQ